MFSTSAVNTTVVVRSLVPVAAAIPKPSGGHRTLRNAVKMKEEPYCIMLAYGTSDAAYKTRSDKIRKDQTKSVPQWGKFMTGNDRPSTL